MQIMFYIVACTDSDCAKCTADPAICEKCKSSTCTDDTRKNDAGEDIIRCKGKHERAILKQGDYFCNQSLGMFSETHRLNCPPKSYF